MSQTQNCAPLHTLMLAVYRLSHVPALLILELPGAPAGTFGPLAFLLIVSQGSDVAQYLAGKTFGRTPLAPRISPRRPARAC